MNLKKEENGKKMIDSLERPNTLNQNLVVTLLFFPVNSCLKKKPMKGQTQNLCKKKENERKNAEILLVC